MTARQLYEGVLIELNKENAPNVLLEDFNYFANKAINNYVNKRYNIYDINQQTTDDLRVLKATAMLKPVKVNDYKGLTMAGENKMATYEVIMPSDYLHILNCICIYKVNKTYKCYNKNDYWRAPATRLTADMYSLVLDNFWNKPTYKRPYYYIHNVNLSKDHEKTGSSSWNTVNGLNRSNINYATLPTNPYNIDDSEYSKPKNTNSDESLTDITILGGTNLLNALINDGLILQEHDVEDLEVLTFNYYDDFRKSGEFTVDNGTIIKKYKLPSRNNSPGTSNSDDVNPIGSGTDVNHTTQFESVYPADDAGTITFGTDAHDVDIVTGENYPYSIKVGENNISNVERGAGIRYGNVSEVRLEIRYGSDNSVFLLTDVYVDYIKAPQNIRLTQREIDLTEDTSQMLEYPDYVCQEIINELVHLIMENISDLRLQTHPVVSLSIANPAQALTQQAAQGLSAQ